MKKTLLIITLFITGICFGQNEIIHVSKTHRDGTPKEVIIYEIVNDDLTTNETILIRSFHINIEWIFFINKLISIFSNNFLF